MSYLRVPRVSPVPRPAWDAGLPARTPLPEVADTLLSTQQAERRTRAEARSLRPADQARLAAQLEAERAVEENLARGRAATREEIRHATDLSRMAQERDPVAFPEFGARERSIPAMVAWMAAAIFAPFLAYFALTALV